MSDLTTPDSENYALKPWLYDDTAETYFRKLDYDVFGYIHSFTSPNEKKAFPLLKLPTELRLDIFKAFRNCTFDIPRPDTWSETDQQMWPDLNNGPSSTSDTAPLVKRKYHAAYQEKQFKIARSIENAFPTPPSDRCCLSLTSTSPDEHVAFQKFLALFHLNRQTRAEALECFEYSGYSSNHTDSRFWRRKKVPVEERWEPRLRTLFSPAGTIADSSRIRFLRLAVVVDGEHLDDVEDMIKSPYILPRNLLQVLPALEQLKFDLLLSDVPSAPDGEEDGMTSELERLLVEQYSILFHDGPSLVVRVRYSVMPEPMPDPM